MTLSGPGVGGGTSPLSLELGVTGVPGATATGVAGGRGEGAGTAAAGIGLEGIELAGIELAGIILFVLTPYLRSVMLVSDANTTKT